MFTVSVFGQAYKNNQCFLVYTYTLVDSWLTWNSPLELSSPCIHILQNRKHILVKMLMFSNMMNLYATKCKRRVQRNMTVINTHALQIHVLLEYV